MKNTGKISAVLALSLLLTCLCGCAGRDRSSVPDIQPEPETAVAETAQEPEPAEDLPEETKEDTETGTEAEAGADAADVTLEELPEEPVPEAAPVVFGHTTERVKLREGAGENHNVIRVLDRGTFLQILGTEGGWTNVYTGSEFGYVFSEYVAAETGPSMEPASEQPQGEAWWSAGRIVVIDPGHQAAGDSAQEPNGPGSSIMKARVTGGTRGRTTGVYEYELNLDVSLQLKTVLEARGYTVYLTRETHDVNISNKERAQFATDVGADIAVRIHANGVEDSSVSGALSMAPSTDNPYCAQIAGDSQLLARCVIDAYCESTGMNNQGVSISDTMSGMNWSTIPVTILEMGYMTNPTDDTNMEDPAYQSRMVSGIADGIDRYFISKLE